MDTWVLLRGLTRGSAHWAGFDAELANTKRVRVIALDLPGNGALCDLPSPTTVQDMARHCHEALRSLGVTEQVRLVGMSLGGMVAAEWAAQWPQEVRDLVLINTSARTWSWPWQRMRPRALTGLMWPLLMGGDAAACESAILRITANHPRKEVLADWQAARLLHPVSFANTWRQLLAAAQYRAPLAAPVRTLVLAGVQDQLVNVQCSQALATQWSSTLCLHPTAGHDLTLDDAPWVLKEIRRWHERTRPD